MLTVPITRKAGCFYNTQARCLDIAKVARYLVKALDGIGNVSETSPIKVTFDKTPTLAINLYGHASHPEYLTCDVNYYAHIRPQEVYYRLCIIKRALSKRDFIWFPESPFSHMDPITK